jgi:hypothetical protein
VLTTATPRSRDACRASRARACLSGADQIPEMRAASPRERLQCLVEMLAFEERAHKAVRLPKVP